MIYIIVHTSGEYGDYKMTNLFATTSKPKAEAKLTELQDIQARSLKVYAEIHPIITEQYNKSWRKGLDHEEWLYFKQEQDTFKDKMLEQILPKYNLSRQEYLACFENIFIQELEEL